MTGVSNQPVKINSLSLIRLAGVDRIFDLLDILAKGFQIEPLVYLGIVLGLLAARLASPLKRAVA